MASHSATLTLSSEEGTVRLGEELSAQAKPGDCILLHGQIGAGKSALARSFICARIGIDTEVPSPTFTLVQTYEEAQNEIWHADLYRLTDPQEAVELGLVDAFKDHICLVEWPELLGDLVPDNALCIHLDVFDDFHRATLSFGENWADRLRGISFDAP